MKKYRYHEDNSDHILFIKRWDGKITLLIIYVNDMVVTGGDVVEMETGMLRYALAETSIVQNHHLAIYPDQVPTNKERYQRLVGRLIYLLYTRPDIAYAVGVLSQFMPSPNEDAAIMRILCYLKKAPS
ncbi:unnamed protein product [Prunus armeniaca]